jgi:ABC-type branched-subunit amino acid transport system ATPase component
MSAIETILRPSRREGGTAMSALLEVEGVGKAFGGVRFEGMDFPVAEGAICGVIGPNGSGKSTLLGEASLS